MVRCRDVGGEGGSDDGGGSCGIGDWCGGGGGGGDAAGGSGKHSSDVCAARTLGSLGLTPGQVGTCPRLARTRVLVFGADRLGHVEVRRKEKESHEEHSRKQK